MHTIKGNKNLQLHVKNTNYFNLWFNGILFLTTRAMNTILFEEDYLEINFLYLKCWKSSQGLKLQRLKVKSLKKVFDAYENMKA